MGERFQIFEANVDMSRAFRQFQKADNAFVKDKDDLAKKHLANGLGLFKKVAGHLANAVEDVYQSATDEINKGNNELQKSVDAYANGNDDSAANHYDNALNHYDKVLDILD